LARKLEIIPNGDLDMKLPTLSKAFIALGIFASLAYTVSAAADQGVTPGSLINSIETAPLQPTLEQQQQLTETLSEKVILGCAYCATTSDIQITELGLMEVTTVIGTEPFNRSRVAFTRLHQISTFNAPETHL
jgi:hypothetical protein